MRKLLCLLVVILITSGAQALYFDIAPASGFSEPLSSGDVIEISATTQPSVGHSYALSSFRMFYNTTYLGEVSIPGLEPFEIDGGGNVTGSATLDVGTFMAANFVELHIATTSPPQMYHWYSNNQLEVQPTGPMTPTTGTWGLILMLLAVPAFLLMRR